MARRGACLLAVCLGANVAACGSAPAPLGRSTTSTTSATPGTPKPAKKPRASTTRTTSPTAAPTTVFVPPGETGPGAVAGPTRPPDATGPYPVVSVTDGDTIKIQRDGAKETLRLIGLDSPETKDPRKPVQCFGVEATAHAKDLLDGTSVWLTTDPTQDAVDRYGRTLAYVWMADGRLFDWVMIDDGFAHEYTYDLPYEYQDAFKAAERRAREAGRGLWSAATCAGNVTPQAPP